MKNETKQNPPKGYRLVTSGEVMENDLLWDNVDGWGKAEKFEIGSPVLAFNAVARNGKR